MNLKWTLGNLFILLVHMGINIGCMALTPEEFPWKRGWGSLAGVNTAMVVLPATRNSFLTLLFGLPFDHVVIYHRAVGRWAIFCVGMHFGLYWNEMMEFFENLDTVDEATMWK